MKADAAIGAWLEQRRAQGCTRVELWQLATPQQRRIASYDLAGERGPLARELALVASVLPARDSPGHALFAYAGHRVEDEAIGLALLREGELTSADLHAPDVAGRALAMLLRECETCARLLRVVEGSEAPTMPSERRARRRNCGT